MKENQFEQLVGKLKQKFKVRLVSPNQCVHCGYDSAPDIEAARKVAKKKMSSPELVTMTLYHGTGAYAIDGIRAKGLQLQSRSYVARRCACTTTDLQVALLFAFRKSSSDDWIKGNLNGVVLEFLFTGTKRQFAHVKDHHTAQLEHEVAVFDSKALTLVAVHYYDKRGWQRVEESNALETASNEKGEIL